MAGTPAAPVRKGEARQAAATAHAQEPAEEAGRTRGQKLRFDPLADLGVAGPADAVAQLEAGNTHTPLRDRNAVSNTDVMIMASGLLKSANLAVFELGMWQSLAGR